MWGGQEDHLERRQLPRVPVPRQHHLGCANNCFFYYKRAGGVGRLTASRLHRCRQSEQTAPLQLSVHRPAPTSAAAASCHSSARCTEPPVLLRAAAPRRRSLTCRPNYYARTRPMPPPGPCPTPQPHLGEGALPQVLEHLPLLPRRVVAPAVVIILQELPCVPARRAARTHVAPLWVRLDALLWRRCATLAAAGPHGQAPGEAPHTNPAFAVMQRAPSPTHLCRGSCTAAWSCCPAGRATPRQFHPLAGSADQPCPGTGASARPGITGGAFSGVCAKRWFLGPNTCLLSSPPKIRSRPQQGTTPLAIYAGPAPPLDGLKTPRSGLAQLRRAVTCGCTPGGVLAAHLGERLCISAQPTPRFRILLLRHSKYPLLPPT